jgi:hypothetical protein
MIRPSGERAMSVIVLPIAEVEPGIPVGDRPAMELRVDRGVNRHPVEGMQHAG